MVYICTQNGGPSVLKTKGHLHTIYKEHTGVLEFLWKDQQLCKQASAFVRSNACVKGRPNMTVGSFCFWVNNTLLVINVLSPGFPTKINIETARKRLHKLGFRILGSYIDGHESPDVVEYKGKF